MSNFATRLKELRELSGMTQEELGRKVNTTRQTISNYEKGKRNADYTMLEALADTFNVDIGYLLGQTDKTTVIPSNNDINTSFKEMVVMGFDGLDVSKMTDEERDNYYKDLIDMMKLVSLKYKDKK